MTPTDPNAPAVELPATSPATAPMVDLFAEPTVEECLIEWNRYYDDRKAGRISVRVAPEGHHVAYYGGQIIDHDANHIALRNRAASTLGVHPARLVIDYPWMW